MRLSRRDRAALIVLLLAVGALAVDRLLLPAPVSAQANNADAAACPATMPSLDQLLASSPAAAAPDQPWTPVPDVFDLARLGGAVLREALPEIRAEEDAVESFVRAHSLQATVLGPRPMALVGRRKVRVGESLDGFELTRVTDREAVFVSDRGTAILRISRPSDDP